jgi:uncharacterized membrane protein YhaH (DUF805 family)
MNFNDAVVSAYKKYFSIRGRASRSEYWNFVLFAVLIMVLVTVGITVLAASSVRSADTQAASISLALMLAVGIYIFAFAIPLLTLLVRRMHDIGLSGIWVGLVFGLGVAANLISAAQVTSADSLNPVIGIANISSFVLLGASLWPSQPRTNKYGDQPPRRPSMYRTDETPPPAPDTEN